MVLRATNAWFKFFFFKVVLKVKKKKDILHHGVQSLKQSPATHFLAVLANFMSA